MREKKKPSRSISFAWESEIPTMLRSGQGGRGQGCEPPFADNPSRRIQRRYCIIRPYGGRDVILPEIYRRRPAWLHSMPRAFRETWLPTEWARSRVAVVGVARSQEPFHAVIGIESVLRRAKLSLRLFRISYIGYYMRHDEWQWL